MLVFNQAKSWNPQGGPGPYSQKHCCFCSKPVSTKAPRLWIVRTSDGEWWLVPPGHVATEDDFGDGVFSLPIGSKCLRDHPEFMFALADG